MPANGIPLKTEFLTNLSDAPSLRGDWTKKIW